MRNKKITPRLNFHKSHFWYLVNSQGHPQLGILHQTQGMIWEQPEVIILDITLMGLKGAGGPQESDPQNLVFGVSRY